VFDFEVKKVISHMKHRVFRSLCPSLPFYMQLMFKKAITHWL